MSETTSETMTDQYAYCIPRTINPGDVSVPINGTDYTPGCYVDGHWGQYGSSRVLRIADDVLGGNMWQETYDALKADHSLIGEWATEDDILGTMVDELAACEHVTWAAEEAEEKLNDATPDGWAWGWEDGEFFLARTDGYSFEVQCIVDDGAHLNYDGDTFTPAHGHVWSVGVVEHDDDPTEDEGTDVGTFYASWEGGCYLNLWETGGDAEELADNVAGTFVGGAAECLHIGDDHTPNAAYSRLVGWVRDYADREDGSDWSHDASHYGFPY